MAGGRVSMSASSERRLLRALRFLTLLLLAGQAALLLKDLVSWFRMMGLCVLFFLYGTLQGRMRLRFWVRLCMTVAAPFALRLAAFSVFGLVGVFLPGAAADGLFSAFDETFYPLLPLWWWTLISTENAERSQGFVPVEAGLNLVFMAALLWSQGGFKITLYPHPSLLAAAAAGLLFLSLAELAVLRPKLSGRGTAAVARLGGFFAVLALVLLLILNRYSDDAASGGGGLLKPTLFRFDLSRYLKLETEISLSDELVLIVRKDPADANVFLRRYVLSDYDRRGAFRPGPMVSRSTERLPRAELVWSVPPWRGREPLEQEYWILNLDREAFLAVDAPVSVTPYRLGSGASFSSAYSVVSSAPVASLPLLLLDFDPDRVEPAFALSPAERALYTEWGGDPRIRSLAQEAAQEAGTYYERVHAVLSYLRDNYFYSLKPGAASDGDQLAWFLFQGKKGYCSYFAFSMALLLRSLDIPARVAAGFYVDPASSVLEFHPVRADMAHAWTEVWFGEYGWIAFDPTSTTPAPGERFEEARGTDPALLERLLREILRRGTLSAVSPEPGESGASSSRDPLGRAASWVIRHAGFLLPSAYLTLVAAGRLLRAGLRRRTREERRRILAAWDALEESLSAAGFRRDRGESVPDFGDRLDRQVSGILGSGYGALARAWEEALYAPAVAPETLRSVEAETERLRVRVAKRTGIARRVLAFLDIRAAFRPLPGGRR